MKMIDMELMDVDLSIVKKEKIELEDYEKDSVHLLDNFISEHDYNDFPPTSMPCGENEDGNVDWLTGFFDEPLNDNMSGLNPPLSDISHSGSTSVSQITSINCSSDILLDSYPTFSEDYINNTMDTSSLKLSPAMITKPSSNICNRNPFLSQTQTMKDNDLDTVKLEEDIDEITVKLEEDSPLTNTSHSNDMQIDKPLNSTQTIKTSPSSTKISTAISNNLAHKQSNFTVENKPQNQQKLLLFMNTPENRAKLAGTNFNIINANLLSKISGQQQNGNSNDNTTNNNNNNNNVSNKNMNLINLKKCVNLNNTVRNEHCYQDTSNLRPSDATSGSTMSTATVNAALQSIMMQTQKDKKILPVDILGNGNNSYGFTRKDRSDSQEIDSGYESPTSSSGSSPCSPPIELERKESCDTIQYIDIPPHERQPFYLSEEEKRTLVMEGLPVPSGLPLNKTEERALKKVRRKIKNKISAQESRRKKKEYMESLEKKVDVYATENNILKKKIGSLEVANRSLIIQVQKLQALVASKISPPSSTSQDVTEVTEVIEESS